MRRAFAAMLILSGCGVVPEPQAMVSAVAPNVPSHVAATGEVMVIGPDASVETRTPGYTALSFAGMRSPGEAVFIRTRLDALPPSVRATSIPGVFVPIRSGSPQDEGPFIPPRGAGAGDGGAEEIVLKPALGAVFGVDDLMVLVTEISPGRVTYQIDSFNLIGALQ